MQVFLVMTGDQSNKLLFDSNLIVSMTFEHIQHGTIVGKSAFVAFKLANSYHVLKMDGRLFHNNLFLLTLLFIYRNSRVFHYINQTIW